MSRRRKSETSGHRGELLIRDSPERESRELDLLTGNKQERGKMEGWRDGGRASHSCRDGGGWECYLPRVKRSGERF